MKRQFKVPIILLETVSLPLKEINELNIEMTMSKDYIIFNWEDKDVDNEDPTTVAFSLGLLISNTK